MKIAVTAKGADIDAEVDPRFGRAAYILIIDSETMEYQAVDNNENVRSFQGAGINAASMVSQKGVEVLLTGYCGPKAFKVVDTAGIKVVNDVAGNVKDALAQFMAGNYEFADAANAESHW